MVGLLVVGNNSTVMSNSLDQKVKKLYAARSKREAKLHAIHEDILHCMNNQSRRVKIERLVTKCNEAFLTVVDAFVGLHLLEERWIQVHLFLH